MNKDIADAVGLPTAWDKDNLARIINRFEKKNPGMIMHTVKEAKDQYKAVGGRRQEFGEVNKQAHGRVMLELPVELKKELALRNVKRIYYAIVEGKLEGHGTWTSYLTEDKNYFVK